MPIYKPMVNKSLDQMNALQRTAECFRYFLLSIEFWISPDGKVREWIKSNARLAVFIATPTFLALPIVTMALWELSSCANALTAIAGKLFVLPVLLLLVLLSIFIVCRILSAFKR